ncbi:hypothetical protein [Caulobacter endophyticus]|uniref:Uncharacterized protein n=1 Tax=Caulobacter endophyticus TaxID=2172652 RepID=A0A2T9KBB5_9CAUL|nr:hypothetical protein [Caulobacter endophyticus]PVM93260.1 hypothetical protein DDF67_03785 [Caulobacter endophyticus]
MSLVDIAVIGIFVGWLACAIGLRLYALSQFRPGWRPTLFSPLTPGEAFTPQGRRARRADLCISLAAAALIGLLVFFGPGS